MTHTISSDRFRIGKNIGWNVFFSSLYFNRGLRVQLVLTLILKIYMSVLGIQVIKLFLSWENRVLKFNIIGLRLTRLVISPHQLKDKVTTKEVVPFSAWAYTPTVNSFENNYFTKLDNYVHNLSYLKPRAHKFLLSEDSFYNYMGLFEEEALDESSQGLSSYEKKSKKTYYSLDYLTQITLFQAAAITSILKKNAGAGTNQRLISNCSWAEGLFKILVYENAKDKYFLFTEGYGGNLSNFVSSLFNRFDKEILEFFKLLLCNGVLVDDLKKKVFEIRLLNFNKFKSIINNPRVVGEIFKDSLKIRTGQEPAASEHLYFLLFLLAILRKKKKKTSFIFAF